MSNENNNQNQTVNNNENKENKMEESKLQKAYSKIKVSQPRTRLQFAAKALGKGVASAGCLGFSIYCADKTAQRFEKKTKSAKDYAEAGGFLAAHAISLVGGSFLAVDSIMDGSRAFFGVKEEEEDMVIETTSVKKSA